ncbi:MAG: hypothetical protein US30_C0013G0029 [Candidatus Moranbacteria bacterium GW2011_GWF2_36_839]|nr:MAG: hypothetical protein US27_C0013G0029 [Candidatus Moranbacteria bacterium GW2011_GWF1_36_78]KKQ16632.1 MAG: hypothetical protein US30_C0013G0029 [Candidatus Moranbacteria bacterium GW2011_GWF2_36_839]
MICFANASAKRHIISCFSTSPVSHLRIGVERRGFFICRRNCGKIYNIEIAIGRDEALPRLYDAMQYKNKNARKIQKQIYNQIC